MAQRYVPYFAYGSNLNIDDFSWRAPLAELGDRARLRGWRLSFNGVADIEPAEGRTVEGAYWWLTPECVDAIDGYEGAPNFYRHEIVEVETEDRGALRALTYVMCRKRPGLPSPLYYRTIEEGYEHFGIPLDTLEQALRETKDAHKKLDILHYRQDHPKRMMAVVKSKKKGRNRPAGVRARDITRRDRFGRPASCPYCRDPSIECGCATGTTGMSPATRRLYDLERADERRRTEDDEQRWAEAILESARDARNEAVLDAQLDEAVRCAT